MADTRRCVLALGFFDGVHLGHSALLELTKQRAREMDAVSGVLTFDTHPDTLVKGIPVRLINSSAGRVDILERIYGMEKVILLHFDDSMMRMGPCEFIRWVRDRLGAVHLVVGHDYKFGYKGAGNTTTLSSICEGLGMTCDIVRKVERDGIRISSTYIRELLSKGEVERANEFLGHPYMLMDTVRSGFKVGRSIGTPTINMKFPEGVLIPPFGVYITKVFLESGEHVAVTNIGVRPTFGEGFEVSVESFILDFDDNIYGKQVRVEFYKYIRPEMKFESPAALKAQIEQDARSAREYFAAK